VRYAVGLVWIQGYVYDAHSAAVEYMNSFLVTVKPKVCL